MASTFVQASAHIVEEPKVQIVVRMWSKAKTERRLPDASHLENGSFEGAIYIFEANIFVHNRLAFMLIYGTWLLQICAGELREGCKLQERRR